VSKGGRKRVNPWIAHMQGGSKGKENDQRSILSKVSISMEREETGLLCGEGEHLDASGKVNEATTR